MLQSAVCQRHKTPSGMRNFTGLALHFNSKNECSSKHWCCWESLAHELYVCQPLCAAQECGAGELEEASSLSGNTLSGNDIHKNRFYVLWGIFQKATSNRAQTQHVRTAALCRKYLLAFDVLRRGLIFRKWKQWGDGAEGLVPLIPFVGINWSDHVLLGH